MNKISKFTERFLYNTKVRKGDFDWDILNMTRELTDGEEALRQLNGLIVTIATDNRSYPLDRFKADVMQAIEEVEDDNKQSS
jgi:hypothetical protein